MRYPEEETAERHARIVKKAAKLFRERGFEDVTVAEVMKAAGLTHGAFYSHFGSKEELMAAAVDAAMQGTLDGVKEHWGTAKGRAEYTERYLSRKHRDEPGKGCVMSSLTDEIRNEPAVRDVFTAKVKAIVDAMGGERTRDLTTLSAMVGAVALARAVNDEDFSREILRGVEKGLRGREQVRAD